MAQIEPCKAIRFNQRDVSDLIAPPYDILKKADKKALLEKNDHNIVAIDLPHIPPKSAGPDSCYAKAAGDLTCWLDIRAMAHDDRPAIYAYHQTYKLGGQELTRKKFLARLRLEEFGAGGVFPHEQTFGGPKEDRLKLTAATRCNVSPIFGLYSDPDNEVCTIIDEAIEREPDQVGMLDDVENKLWVIDDLPTIKSIQVRMSDKPIFIADGHHRYGTALNYREQRLKEDGKLAEDSPVQYVLAVFGGMEDPGATIQPYFRTIADLPLVTSNDLQAAMAESFDWKPVTTPADADELAELLAKAGPQSMALHVAKDEACAVVTPRKNDMLQASEPKKCQAWRQSAYAILHHFILHEIVRPQFNDGNDATMHYHKTLAEAIADAAKSKGIACLMPATTMNQLREICLAGDLMPQKSTYFYPKLATGMVINPLY